jgi:hypothetical protein
MKGARAAWIFTILSVFCFAVTFFQTASDFGWWEINSAFIWGLEKFTFFVINPISLIVCIILSARLIFKYNQIIHIVTIVIPVLSVGLSIYLFWARFLVEIFT